MQQRWKSLKDRCAPMGILCVVLFIVLPIIVALPLVLWLTRQMDRMPLWGNRSASRQASCTASPSSPETAATSPLPAGTASV
jgi:hypothetical protein